MSRFAIRTENLGKRFRLARPGHGLHEAMERLVSKRRHKSLPHSLWALKEVSLEVEHGEVLGLVGRNGAGKSVLLKILARVTAPTKGSAELFGRVAPLLEVGAGFHPELSGRENVYFNGSILGMDREEIRRRFDEIVAFAGVEPFIDTPVKLYSTGMRMRLAFSVAAHVEPEILLIDEALSVGDSDFRARSRQKIREFIERGCTMLVVSHDTAILKELCSRAVLLQAGEIAADGDLSSVMDQYSRIH